MKASELIRNLENLKAAHGDLDVGIYCSEYASYEDSYQVRLRHAERGSFGDADILPDLFFGIS